MPLTPIDFINISVGIASLALAVISIYLALYFYTKSKDAELNTAKLLTKTETQVGLIQKITTRMLDKFVTRATTLPGPEDMTAKLLASLAATSGTNPLEGSDESRASQPLVTTYITTMYWSAIANAALQDRLPDDIASLEEPSNAGVRELLAKSKSDYFVAKAWLDAKGGELVNTSTAFSYYDHFQNSSPDSLMRDAAEVYAERAQNNQQANN